MADETMIFVEALSRLARNHAGNVWSGPGLRKSVSLPYEVNLFSMESQQYQSIVNVHRKRVNHLRKDSQPFPGERVNLFLIDRQMLKKSRPKQSQPYLGKDIPSIVSKRKTCIFTYSFSVNQKTNNF